EELITAEAAVESIAGSGSSRARRRSLSSTDIANVFDVELEQSTTDEPAVEKRPRAAKKKTARKKAAKKKSARKNAKQFLPTARSIAQLRRRHSMSKIQFSEAVGVSSATISNWENARGGIRLRESSRLGLYKLFEQKPA
ncbi:MAG: DNA-binding transcriptional regulator YiaG, partial [Verrucomicrobiales bacterium]